MFKLRNEKLAMLQKDQAFSNLKDLAYDIMSSIDLGNRQDVVSKLDSLVSLIRSENYRTIIANVSLEEIWADINYKNFSVQICEALLVLQLIQYLLLKHNYDTKLNPIFEIGLIICSRFIESPNEYITQKVISHFFDSTQPLANTHFSKNELRSLIFFQHPGDFELISYLKNLPRSDLGFMMTGNLKLIIEIYKSLTDLKVIEEYAIDTVRYLTESPHYIERETKQHLPITFSCYLDFLRIVKTKLEESVEVEAQCIASKIKDVTDKVNRTLETISSIQAELEKLRGIENSATTIAPTSTKKLFDSIHSMKLELEEAKGEENSKIQEVQNNTKPKIPALLNSLNQALEKWQDAFKAFLSSTHLQSDTTVASDKNPYIKPQVDIPVTALQILAQQKREATSVGM